MSERDTELQLSIDLLSNPISRLVLIDAAMELAKRGAPVLSGGRVWLKVADALSADFGDHDPAVHGPPPWIAVR